MVGHAFEQDNVGRVIAGHVGRIVHIDRVRDDILLTGQRAHIGLVKEPRVLVSDVALGRAVRQRDRRNCPRTAHVAEQSAGARSSAIRSRLRQTVADEYDVVFLAGVRDRADIDIA